MFLSLHQPIKNRDMKTYTQKEIDEVMNKMIKGVVKGEPENPVEVIRACTERGTHLVEVDEHGDCVECCYSETLEEILKANE
jgi:hypothetical protein